MITGYCLTSSIAYLALFIMWQRSSNLNIIIKFFLMLLTIFGLVAALASAGFIVKA